MTALGIFLTIVAIWAWAWPESVGKWCAYWRDAYDNKRTELWKEKNR